MPLADPPEGFAAFGRKLRRRVADGGLVGGARSGIWQDEPL